MEDELLIEKIRDHVYLRIPSQILTGSLMLAGGLTGGLLALSSLPFVGAAALLHAPKKVKSLLSEKQTKSSNKRKKSFLLISFYFLNLPLALASKMADFTGFCAKFMESTSIWRVKESIDNYEKFIEDKNPLSKALFLCNQKEFFRLLEQGYRLSDLQENILLKTLDHSEMFNRNEFIQKMFPLNFPRRFKEELFVAYGFRKEIVERALAEGLDPNVMFEGSTPILNTIEAGSEELFNLLLQNGADITKGRIEKMDIGHIFVHVNLIKDATVYEVARYKMPEMLPLVEKAYEDRDPELLKNIKVQKDSEIDKNIEKEKNLVDKTKKDDKKLFIELLTDPDFIFGCGICGICVYFICGVIKDSVQAVQDYFMPPKKPAIYQNGIQKSSKKRQEQHKQKNLTHAEFTNQSTGIAAPTSETHYSYPNAMPLPQTQVTPTEPFRTDLGTRIKNTSKSAPLIALQQPQMIKGGDPIRIKHGSGTYIQMCETALKDANVRQIA